MTAATAFGRHETRARIAVPTAGDDKYSRGVLGVVTGSAEYPGAAVLGVEGAVRTGLGMVRYLGADRAADFVLHRRPEVVTAEGRVQAWLIGSGLPPDRAAGLTARLTRYLRQGVPAVLDAGALDLVDAADGPVVVTPHFGELVTLLRARGVDVERKDVAADPEAWARRAAQETGVTVLLKGSITHIADVSGSRYAVQVGPPWVATAGAGDVLGGVLGAMVATHAADLDRDPSVLADLAAAAAWLHGEAGRRASAGGPIGALDIAEALPGAIRDLLDADPSSRSS